MAIVKVSRRDFFTISSTATAGLVLAVSVPDAFAQKKRASFGLGPFIEIGTDGIVTVWVTKSDMGQGVRTALPMIVAEELGADWNRVRIRQAHYDRKFGSQGTGGSGSIRSMWNPLRQAGAAARAMLVSAAAAKLAVDPASLTVRDGVVTHGPSKRKLTFAQLAEPASKLEVPKEVKLKDPSEFTIIGKTIDRIDNRDIVTGQAAYGIDVRVPGMLYAVVLRSPAFGGTIATLEESKAKAVPGVKQIVRIEAIGTDLPWNGVGVIATNTYAAMQGRDALEVTWNAGGAAAESSATLRAQLAEAVKTSARSIHDVGNVDRAMASPEKVVEATYELPYLAHATMEPLNAVASVTSDGVEIWTGTQFPGWVNSSVAALLKVKPEQVKVNVTMLGGGFGRRANPDFALEAALLSKAVGAPVKVTWTREDDMQHDYYRPASHHHVRAAIDKEGKIVAWHHRFAAPSITGYFEPGARKPWDSEAGGIEDLPFAIDNIGVDFALVPSVVPRGWWRSVEHSINAFVINSFLDEIARATNRDPIDLQLSLLPAGKKSGEGNFPFEADRLRRVIEVARDRSNWGKPSGDGQGRGFAAQWSFLSYAAQVADVTVKDGQIRVDRIVCAIDCGIAINPDMIRSQVEGGIVYGLSAALGQEITIEGGAVQQSNFHDFPLLRIDQMPVVEVHIIPSAAPPTGVGEPGLPPAAPAVANAIYDATGKRLRTLPFKLT